MPKEFINTYSTFNFVVNGKQQSARVAKIVSEEAHVNEVSKEVGVFEKFSSKKAISSKIYNRAALKEEGRSC